MSETTELFLKFRECARQVWNNFMQDLPDGWHEFNDVEYELFNAIVLVQTDEAKDWDSEFRVNKYYPSLRLKPQFGPRGIEAMVGEEKSPNCWHYNTIQVTDPDIQLAYMGFFDWTDKGFRDYQFMRSRVLDSVIHQSLKGKDLLFPALSVEVHYLKSTENAC